MEYLFLGRAMMLGKKYGEEIKRIDKVITDYGAVDPDIGISVKATLEQSRDECKLQEIAHQNAIVTPLDVEFVRAFVSKEFEQTDIQSAVNENYDKFQKKTK